MRTFTADPELMLSLTQEHWIVFVEVKNVFYISLKAVERIKRICQEEYPEAKYEIGQSDIEIEFGGYTIC